VQIQHEKQIYDGSHHINTWDRNDHCNVHWYISVQEKDISHKLSTWVHQKSWDNTVNIVTGFRLDGRGVGVRVLVGPRPAVGLTQLHIQWVLRALFLGIK
jgi:hypothetical protein